MTTYFMDTSALAKRYLPLEIGAKWVKRETSVASKNRIVISELTLAEMTSLLMRNQRQNTLTSADVQRILRGFSKHVRTAYALVNLDARRIQQARQLLSIHSLKTLDTIQLACAIEFRRLRRKTITFVSADTRLLTVASLEGFQVDNPLLHP
ncbi:MAG: type II toxin-antitoxin system VapC family toxin [Anaerolineae bacterium]|nr:type II toxin-antitoxin system VapC family toxin [Anaerolineae bacterium]